MKRLACLSLIVGLLNLPIPVQAQVLTPEAVDCALNLVVFRIFQVTGVNLAPPPQMIPSWRSYLINRYPTLADRYSVANACVELRNILVKWPQISSFERELWLNTWAASLPQDLALIEPVSAGAQQLRAYLQSLAVQPPTAAPSTTPNTEAGAIAELQRRNEISRTLENFDRKFYGQ